MQAFLVRVVSPLLFTGAVLANAAGMFNHLFSLDVPPYDGHTTFTASPSATGGGCFETMNTVTGDSLLLPAIENTIAAFDRGRTNGKKWMVAAGVNFRPYAATVQDYPYSFATFQAARAGTG